MRALTAALRFSMATRLDISLRDTAPGTYSAGQAAAPSVIRPVTVCSVARRKTCFQVSMSGLCPWLPALSLAAGVPVAEGIGNSGSVPQRPLRSKAKNSEVAVSIYDANI